MKNGLKRWTTFDDIFANLTKSINFIWVNPVSFRDLLVSSYILLEARGLFKILSTCFSWLKTKRKIPSFLKLTFSNLRVSFINFFILSKQSVLLTITSELPLSDFGQQFLGNRFLFLCRFCKARNLLQKDVAVHFYYSFYKKSAASFIFLKSRFSLYKIPKLQIFLQNNSKFT